MDYKTQLMRGVRQLPGLPHGALFRTSHDFRPGLKSATDAGNPLLAAMPGTCLALSTKIISKGNIQRGDMFGRYR